MLAMLDAKAHLRPRGAIGAESVRDHDGGGVTADFKSFLMSLCAARLSLRR
jgi:hypothetical protein